MKTKIYCIDCLSLVGFISAEPGVKAVLPQIADYDHITINRVGNILLRLALLQHGQIQY